MTFKRKLTIRSMCVWCVWRERERERERDLIVEPCEEQGIPVDLEGDGVDDDR